ncbi:pentatricopeptide repeat-containing protein At1g80270, mitochondrial-like [Chenopodium quinoa]|uniref:PROP1-like PPR domain-containing protein n=1 Tax=Chenopodium quinoa TaxID=63459 RepID=A0A803MJ62_CHEQI|nr:pentatricopeptide repeat-containing protein At1g80270, mitochondrial-like [Chenopodium quinoa]
MWALRRASANSIRAQGLNVAAFRACAGLGQFSGHTEDKSKNCEHRGLMRDRWITSNACQCTVHFPNKFSAGSRSLSSEAGAKSGGEEEDDLEEGFSELETPDPSVSTGGGVEDSDSSSDSESDLSSVDENTEETLEAELLKGAGEMSSAKKLGHSPLLKLLFEESGSSLSKALDNYATEGKDLNRAEVYHALLNLRRRKMFSKALQLSEWLDKREDFELTERDYASRVDLIAKVRGLHKAETFIDTIPKSHRQEVVYRTLLANCVSLTNVAKSEEIFNKMKDLGFPISPFTCNQLLVLYKRTDKKKIADVLLMMEKDDIKPTLFTYQLLIDTKGLSNDIIGMEQIVETMRAEGVKPNFRVQATLARHYAFGGLKEKAEAILQEMEGDDLNSNRGVCPILLLIYANLGKADDVERLWKVCEPKPREGDYLAAIEAFGKLKNVEQAEAVYHKMEKSIKKLSTRHYSCMLKVYAENKMLGKGKQLLKQMGNSGCQIGPVAWDAVVKLYVDAGEVEKADSILLKATSQNQQKRPLFSSYISILDQYAKRGDIHNAEKMFLRMKQAGYVSRARPFSALLQAYINAKVPAYGFRERMKADNIFPNKGLAGQLAQVDAFSKNAVSDLLD